MHLFRYFNVLIKMKPYKNSYSELITQVRYNIILYYVGEFRVYKYNLDGCFSQVRSF